MILLLAIIVGVVALDQLFAAGRAKIGAVQQADVGGQAAFGAHAAAGEPLDDGVVRQHEVQDRVDPGKAAQRLSLRLARMAWPRRSRRPEGSSIVFTLSGPTSRMNMFFRLSSRYPAASKAKSPAMQ